MKSGSWSSYVAAGATGPQEPDDDGPPPETSPAEPVPGHRFIRKAAHNRWDVYDWDVEGCACIGTVRGKEGEPYPRGDCPMCKGTGDDGAKVPYLLYADMAKYDAKLVAFGVIVD